MTPRACGLAGLAFGVLFGSGLPFVMAQPRELPAMVVTLTGPKGNAFPVQVKNKDNLNKVKVGDTVEIHATETMAIAVTGPKKN